MLTRALPNAQVVVITTGALPLVVPVGASGVKFTVAGPAATVSDSARTALSATVATLEFSAWAFEAWPNTIVSARAPRMIRAFLNAFMNPPPFEFESEPKTLSVSNTGATFVKALELAHTVLRFKLELRSSTSVPIPKGKYQKCNKSWGNRSREEHANA